MAQKIAPEKLTEQRWKKGLLIGRVLAARPRVHSNVTPAQKRERGGGNPSTPDALSYWPEQKGLLPAGEGEGPHMGADFFPEGGRIPQNL